MTSEANHRQVVNVHAEALLLGPASALAEAVRAGMVSAQAVTEAALARIAALNPGLNAFTDVTAARARATAAAIDARIAGGEGAGLPLAGVPFSVKNLFDVKGLPTRAGAKINRERAPAPRDATLVERLEAQGAVLVGAVNMGEYAFDFTGENAHDGASLNPHDPSRMAGGSSGGSGTAVASGMTPLSLGSDTNGSIRVPSSFCGLFGLKPTFGRLSRARTFPFVGSLDHLGPIGRSVRDLALAFDALQGPDAEDPHLAAQPVLRTLPTLADGLDGLRIGALGGYFRHGAQTEALAALTIVAKALKAVDPVTFPHAAEARAAAYLITAAEGAGLHLDRLRHRAADFDPEVRGRFFAGATLPAVWIERAHKVRRHVAAEVAGLFREFDVLIAPATPCIAPKSGTKTIDIAGATMPLRPNIGIFTQPISFLGLPVVAVPVWTGAGGLPVGVQIIAAPWREDVALRTAAALEAMGICRAPVAGTHPSP